MAEDRIKIVTKISSFLDCEKSFQNIETMVNDLTARINAKAESETIEEEGKTGDSKVIQNADKSFAVEIRTEEGWKKATAGGMPVLYGAKAKDEGSKIKKSIDEIEATDTSTGAEDAKKTIFDEKADKFVLPRPDFDTGWMYLDRDDSNKRVYTFEHGLNFSNGSPSLVVALYKDSYGNTSGDAATNYVYRWKRFENDAASSGTWVGADYRISDTTIFVQCYSGYHVYHTWQDDSEPTGTHRNWDDIDGRILLWK